MEALTEALFRAIDSENWEEVSRIIDKMEVKK